MLTLLLACSHVATFTVSDSTTETGKNADRTSGGTWDTQVETVTGTDTATDTDTDTATTDTTDVEPDTTRVFNLDDIHHIDLVIDAAGIRSLRQDPYTWVTADLTWDGASYPSIGARIKGRLGSLRSLTGKAAFKLDFLEYGEDKKLEGLEKINLNNMVQDGAQIKEVTSYTTFRAMGIPAPRVAYGWVTVNGEDYGVYSVVEEYDDEFLKANWPDPSGNLYDGDYDLHTNGNYDLVDFIRSTQDQMGLDEGTDVGRADVHAVTAAAAQTAGSDRFEPTVGALIDLHQFARFWAVTAWIGQYDSYCYYSNNYRVYFDPADGLGELLPWDPDWAFYASTPLESPYGVLAQGCIADPVCFARFKEEIASVSATVAEGEVRAEAEKASALIAPYFLDDPRAEISSRDRAANERALYDWLDTRGAALAAEFP